MKQNVLLCTLALLTFAIGSQAQDWNLAGNNNAAFTSKLGTTTAVPLNLTTSNLTRIRIAVDGKVGVGTINPQQRFHVEGTSNQAIFVNTSALGPTSGSGMIGYVKGLPTAAGNRLGYFLLGSRGGAENNYNVAGMVGYAGDAWTASSRPAYLAFETVASGSTTRTERLRITPEGHVGIGNSSPLNKLVVTDNTRNGPTARIENRLNSSFYNDGLYITAGSDAGATSTVSWFVAFTRPDGGAIGSVSQADAFSVAYNTTSDKRLKANIRETKFGLADVKKIEVKDYNFQNSNSEQTGFLAQQLYEVFPEAVAVGGEDPKARPWMVDYGRITPLLVKAVQELSKENEELQRKVTEVDELKKQMAELKALIKGSNTGAVTYNAAYLEQNAPNPVLGSTTIRYNVPETSTSARINITNAKGQIVRTISINSKGAGQVNFNTSTLAAGTYNYTLYVDGRQADTKRLIIAK